MLDRSIAIFDCFGGDVDELLLDDLLLQCLRDHAIEHLEVE
jgi:hypothetical protein